MGGCGERACMRGGTGTAGGERSVGDTGCFAAGGHAAYGGSGMGPVACSRLASEIDVLCGRRRLGDGPRCL